MSSSPDVTLTMPDAMLAKAIDQIGQISTAKVLCFTGGEATLRKEKLLFGIARAHQKGLITRLVSNGWWASTPERADKMVKDLKAAGLEELNTSYDDYHAPFMQIDNVSRLVEAGLNNGLRLAVGVLVDNYSKYNASIVKRSIAEHLGISIETLESKVAFIEDYPTPAGRGRKLEDDPQRLPLELPPAPKLEMGCPEIGKTISIHPEGSVKACCGHAMFDTQDLTLGNIFYEDLSDMIKKAQSNLLYWWIHTLGTKRILERIGIEEKYTSICHACRDIFTKHKAEVLEYLKEHRQEVLVNDILLTDTSSRVLNAIKAHRPEFLRKLNS